MLKVAFSPIYQYQLPEKHRFPMIKYELLPEQLLYEGTISEAAFFQPTQLQDEQILLTHTSEYLNKLNTLTLSYKEKRAIGFPIRKELIERGKYIANGTLQCAYHAMDSGVSLNVAGGTHHAFADHGEGFCVFNDIAIAANVLLDKGDVRRILIVDLDVHQGNGTAAIFSDNEVVFTFSMHGAKNYPLRKVPSDCDVNLPDGCGDQQYLNELHAHLPKLLDEVLPDFVFYLAGADVIASDLLGRLSLSRLGAKERDRYVYQQCKDRGIPVAVAMGGGYSSSLVDIVEVHANTFRLAQEMYF